jgi:hypothetical protein
MNAASSMTVLAAMALLAARDLAAVARRRCMPLPIPVAGSTVKVKIPAGAFRMLDVKLPAS